MAAKNMRVDPAWFSPATRSALVALKAALAKEKGVVHAQVTFDLVDAPDVPPTVDIIWET